MLFLVLLPIDVLFLDNDPFWFLLSGCSGFRLIQVVIRLVIFSFFAPVRAFLFEFWSAAGFTKSSDHNLFPICERLFRSENVLLAFEFFAINYYRGFSLAVRVGLVPFLLIHLLHSLLLKLQILNQLVFSLALTAVAAVLGFHVPSGSF